MCQVGREVTGYMKEGKRGENICPNTEGDDACVKKTEECERRLPKKGRMKMSQENNENCSGKVRRKGRK